MNKNNPHPSEKILCQSLDMTYILLKLEEGEPFPIACSVTVASIAGGTEKRCKHNNCYCVTAV